MKAGLKNGSLQNLHLFRVIPCACSDDDKDQRRLLQLTDEQRARGVIAVSAGNHAQGPALAAKHMGVNATIVMPRTTPGIKVDAVKRHGGKVALFGDAYDEASTHAQNLLKEKGLTYIPPYDDPDVIAGQGTVAMELLRQHPAHIDAVFIPVGGGGLCAGMSAYIKYVRPEIKVFAVEPEDAACLKVAMEAQRRVALPQVGLFADGVAVARSGKEPFRVLRKTIDGVITANADEMCAAIKDIFEDTRSIAEPAGALSLAGLKNYVAQTGCMGKTLIAIDSRANTNFDRLRYISERTEIGEGGEAVLAGTILEKPGSYKKFCSLLGKHSIAEFNYRFADNLDAHIFVGVQISPDKNDREDIISLLMGKGYHVVDMTNNELAKLHIRQMVGGHAPQAKDEIVFRFEFPERPGALLNFLTKLASRWNITMFHYPNHGSAYGRAFVGMQVPKPERKEIDVVLKDLGYPYWDETKNEAYQYFLG